MKKVIRASRTSDVIFSDEYFTFMKESGIGRNDTPWEGLKVKSGPLAEKHVIEIRLDRKPAKFEGDPIKYGYYPEGTYVAHGMRSQIDTLDDTRELADILYDAVDFAERVVAWIDQNPDY